MGDQTTPQPIHPVPLGEHVSYVEFRAAFLTLAHSMETWTEFSTIVLAKIVANTTATKIHEFTRMNPPSFIGSKSDKDP